VSRRLDSAAVRIGFEPLVAHVRHGTQSTCSFALRLLRQSKRSRNVEKC
jgi:hypothetical protein